MNRTAEKVLGIIGAVFTFLAIIGNIIVFGFIKVLSSDPVMRQELEMDLFTEEGFSTEDIEMIMGIVDSLAGLGVIITIIMVISLIATIIGIVYIWNDKNRKLAGAMFIVGGLFAFGLSVTSILLYIAAILCFTKKPPVADEIVFIESGPEENINPYN